MDSPRKESLFSGLSLGRAARATPQRSSENLAAHPLLASSSSATSPTTATQGQDFADTGVSATVSGGASTDSFANLPYKPRQRHGGGQGSGSSFQGLANAGSPSTSPVTTTTLGATTSSPSVTITTPSTSSMASTSGNVTARLQLQSLKAAGQRMGLANGSYGMGILDSIFEKGAAATGVIGDDWSEVLRVLMTGKATLLLPTAPSSSLPITPTTLRDHIAFICPAATQSGPVVAVTLSGLVGTLTGETLVFESCTPGNGSLLNALREPLTRSGALTSLKPIFQTPPLSANPAFPTYTLGQPSILPFPALHRASTPASSSRGRAGSSASSIASIPIAQSVASSSSRLNPFASLFGSSANSATKREVVPVETPADVKDGTVSPTPSSPRPSIDSLSLVDTSESEALTVPAYTVSRVIKATEAHKALTKALRGHVRDSLAGIPEKIVERVYKFLLGPVLPLPGQVQGDLAKALAGGSPEKPLDFADPEEVSSALQAFVEAVYDELVASYRADSAVLSPTAHGEMGILRRKGSGSGRKASGEHADETEAQRKTRVDREKREAEEKAERDAAEGTDRVEALICLMLYNQIFCPAASDDSRHDEALSSRIAALNMLDLSLDHLGVRTKENDPTDPDPKKAKRDAKVAKGLDSLVAQVGLELQKLNAPACQSPRDKADVLVYAHKFVVDSLAKLPSIRLRPEGEDYRAEGSEPAVSPALTPESDPTVSVPPPLPPRPASLSSSDSPSSELLTVPSAQGHDPLADSTPRSLEPVADQTIPEISLPDAEGLEDAMASSVLTLHPPAEASSPASDAEDSEDEVDETDAPSSGADLLLPLIIFSVVKSNPSQLVSQLMYLRRYRSAICLTGEVSYAIVNLTAVVEFLEHVDLAELGLGKDSGKVMSVDDLSPIGLTYLDEANAETASIASASSRLRGRVTQVGELAGSAAGSANKVLTGVVDSSWTALRGLINTNAASMVGESADEPAAALLSPASPHGARPAIPPRRASAFSLANVTASVANIAAAAATGRDRSKSAASATESSWGGNREMVDVSSRPASIFETTEHHSDDNEEEDSDDQAGESDAEPAQGHARRSSDVRSIRSVSSIMSKEGRKEEAKAERVSLSNRFASMNVLGRLGSGASASEKPSGAASPVEGSPSKSSSSFLANLTTTRSSSGHRNSLLGQAQPDLFTPAPAGVVSPEGAASPAGSFSSLPITRLSSNQPDVNGPPIDRFLTCEVGDIKLSEVGLLLRDYRRLAAQLATRET